MGITRLEERTLLLLLYPRHNETTVATNTPVLKQSIAEIGRWKYTLAPEKFKNGIISSFPLCHNLGRR
jgi:hypothetical protein